MQVNGQEVGKVGSRPSVRDSLRSLLLFQLGDGLVKRIPVQGLVHSCPTVRCMKPNSMPDSGIRLFSGALTVTVWQFAVLAWFLVGQGYDRSTAWTVAWGSWALVPLIALALMSGVERAGSTWLRYLTALVRSAVLAMAGVWGPAVLVVGVINLKSPFSELWWMLVGVTLVSGTLVLSWQGLKSTLERILFVALVGGAILGWRQLLFSFF